MELLTPDPGLIFWSFVAFLILFFLITKFAWKPILQAVNERDEKIKQSVQGAELAKEEMQKLKKENEDFHKSALKEREKLIKEANSLKDSIITEAKEKAKLEASKIMAQSKEEIKNEKKKAIGSINAEVSKLSIQLAEKVLTKELENKKGQEDYVKNMVDQMNFN